jgi:hypothetical protein
VIRSVVNCKTEGVRRDNPIPRLRSHKKRDNIRMDLREIGWGDMDWMDLAQDRGPVEGPCEHDNEPSGSTKCWKILE